MASRSVSAVTRMALGRNTLQRPVVQVQARAITTNSFRPAVLTRTVTPKAPGPQYPSRTFHSTDHPPPPDPFGDVEKQVLEAAYKHVPEHGFTSTALSLGARDAGFPQISTAAIPDGEFSLVRWHLVKQQEALTAKAPELFGQKGETWVYPIPEKIQMLVWARLLGNKDIIGHWQQALSIMAQPTHMNAASQLLMDLADEIVFLSGDKSVDPSWYATRVGVSAIYVSAELAMTMDQSEGFRDTQQFLQRRMDEARGFRGTMGKIYKFASFNAMGALNIARSWGLKI